MRSRKNVLHFLCALLGCWAMYVSASDFDDAANSLRRKDYDAAAVAFEELAVQGSVQAQAIIGTMYFLGQGVAQDDRKAVYWLKKAAEQGDAGAQANLGTMFFLGRGVETDLSAAVEWSRKAAMQDDPKAQHNLGIAYARGSGVKKDLIEAVKWFHISAVGGYEEARIGIKNLERHMTPDEVSEAQGRAKKWISKYRTAE